MPPWTQPGPRWPLGALQMHGFFGAGFVDDVSVDAGSSQVDPRGSDFPEYPVIGGGVQWKLAGQRVDFGVEFMFSIGWKSDLIAFTSGPGGGVLVVDVDSVVWDLYGGPFLSAYLGERTRAYVSGGPVFQWADYSESGGLGQYSGSGSGGGFYLRTGIEFSVSPGLWAGFAVRRTTTDLDVGSFYGELGVDSTEVVFTLTTGF